MKKVLILGIIIIMSLVSCNTYKSYVKNPDQLTEIRFQSHNSNVDLFFPDKQIYDTNYLKVKFIDYKARDCKSAEEYLESIKKYAAEQGLDALLFFGNRIDNKSITTRTSFISIMNIDLNYTSRMNDLDWSRINFFWMRVLGIKYAKNIHNLDTIIKSQIVFQYDDKSKEYRKISEMNFNPIGECTKYEGVKEITDTIVNDFSLRHLLYEKTDNWTYKEKKGFIIARQFINDNYYKECIFKYDDDLVSEIRIKYKIDTKKYKANISYIYNNKNQIEKANIETKDEEILIAYYKYQGKNISEQLLNKIENEKEVPFIKVEYSYFTNEEAIRYYMNNKSEVSK